MFLKTDKTDVVLGEKPEKPKNRKKNRTKIDILVKSGSNDAFVIKLKESLHHTYTGSLKRIKRLCLHTEKLKRFCLKFDNAFEILCVYRQV